MADTVLLDVPIGYRVGGFEVTGPLASGGWGAVYAGRACDDHGREVALKFIPGATMSSGLRAEIVGREVRYALTANHPNLVRGFGAHLVTDGDRPDLDGSVVLIMERARSSLADALDATPGAPLPAAADILAGICRGLVHLHRRKVVHGDLKPSNVLFVDGRVALADFGLSTEVEGTHGYGPHLGSVDYMPPEWWSEPLDENGARVRPAQDVWAFGVLAYRVLGGTGWPFPGQTPRARALNAAAATAPSLASVPAAWRGILRDCLAPDHAERAHHPSASVLARIEALQNAQRNTQRDTQRSAQQAGDEPGERAAHGLGERPEPERTEPGHARGNPAPADARPTRGRARRRLVVTALGVVVAAAVTAGAVWIRADGEAERPSEGAWPAATGGTYVPAAGADDGRLSADGLLVHSGIPTGYWGTMRRHEHVAVTDVTGDGRPDVLLVRTAPAGTGVWMWSGDALDGAGREVLRIADRMDSLGVAAGDVTGDGHGDLVVYHRGVSGTAEVAVWAGGPDGIGPVKTVVLANSVMMADAKLAVGDVTGDGTADIVLARAEGTATTLHLIVGGPRVGGAGNRVALLDRPLAVTEFAVADVTGDGYADALVRSRDAAGRGELHVAEGNRAGFAEEILTPMRVSPEHAASMIVATDVTGDGAPDVVLGRTFPDAGAVELRQFAGGGRTLGPDEVLLVVGLSRLVI